MIGAGRPSGSAHLQLRDLCVDLASFHLQGIDLDVAAGEYFVLLGPTGAGKTILLEVIAGHHQASRGQVLLNGRDVTRTAPECREVGFVYQDYALFPHLSVAENIAIGLRLRRPPSAHHGHHLLLRLAGQIRPTIKATRGKRSANNEDRIERISQRLSIDHLLHRSPKTLSGGERQRVALARALAVKPCLLLLDQPLSALDPETREALQLELVRVHHALGTTTLHVTHDFEEAVALGDRIAVVHDGRIVQVGTAEDIFRRPASTFVARFVGVRNTFKGTVTAEAGEDRRTFKSADLEMAVETDLAGAAHAIVRPEDLVITVDRPSTVSRKHFRGRVVDITDRGTLIFVTVRIPPNFTYVIIRRSLEEMALREDKEVHITFNPSAVHIFHQEDPRTCTCKNTHSHHHRTRRGKCSRGDSYCSDCP